MMPNQYDYMLKRPKDKGDDIPTFLTQPREPARDVVDNTNRVCWWLVAIALVVLGVCLLLTAYAMAETRSWPEHANHPRHPAMLEEMQSR